MAGRPLRRARMNAQRFGMRNPRNYGSRKELQSDTERGSWWREEMIHDIIGLFSNSTHRGLEPYEFHESRMAKALSPLSDEQLVMFEKIISRD